MKRNTAGQKVGAQVNKKADGTPVTSGTVTVYVTLDAGSQATGTVGSGAATHEGNGYWTYAPSQAETDGVLCAYTFVHTDGVNATVQFDTGAETDLASILALIDTEVAAILADTNELQTDWANGGRLDNILDARASQTSVDDVPTNAELATALAAADDAVLAAISGLGISASDIAIAVWDEPIADHLDAGSVGESLNDAGGAGNPWNAVVEGSLTGGDLLRIAAAVNAGNMTAVKSGDSVIFTYRDVSNLSDIVTGKANRNGSRTEVSVTP